METYYSCLVLVMLLVDTDVPARKTHILREKTRKGVTTKEASILPRVRLLIKCGMISPENATGQHHFHHCYPADLLCPLKKTVQPKLIRQSQSS